MFLSLQSRMNTMCAHLIYTYIFKVHYLESWIVLFLELILPICTVPLNNKDLIKKRFSCTRMLHIVLLGRQGLYMIRIWEKHLRWESPMNKNFEVKLGVVRRHSNMERRKHGRLLCGKWVTSQEKLVGAERRACMKGAHQEAIAIFESLLILFTLYSGSWSSLA